MPIVKNDSTIILVKPLYLVTASSVEKINYTKCIKVKPRA